MDDAGTILNYEPIGVQPVENDRLRDSVFRIHAQVIDSCSDSTKLKWRGHEIPLPFAGLRVLWVSICSRTCRWAWADSLPLAACPADLQSQAGAPHGGSVRGRRAT